MENAELMVQRFKDVAVVDLGGASVLDASTIDILGRNLLDLVERQDHRKLVLDFSNVRFMSSQALGVLLQLKRVMDPLKGPPYVPGRSAAVVGIGCSRFQSGGYCAFGV